MIEDFAEQAPVLIWRCDTSGACTYFNRPWLEFTGRTLEAESGNGWVEGVHPEDVERCLGSFSGALNERREFIVDYRLRRHDGEYRWVLDKGRPIFDRAGEFAGFLGSCVDVTEIKTAESRIEAALDDARRAIRQRDVLIREVHHRVKNNLQVILSLVGLQSRETEDGPVRRGLERLAMRIRSLALVQQELHDDNDIASIELLSFIRRICNGLMGLQRPEGVSVQVTGTVCEVDILLGSAAGVILTEIIGNAVLHGGPGRVLVTVETTPTSRVVSVTDQGPGVPADAPKGLGLLLAERIAMQAGIRLSVASGPGAKVMLEMPAT